MSQLCRTCSVPIPEVRLKVLPNTEHCVQCSTEKPKRGFVSGTMKGKSFDIVIVDGDDPTVTYWEHRQKRS